MMRACWILLVLLVGGCVSGGDGEPDLRAAMPADTYETCSGGGSVVEGVNFLSTGGSSGTIRLGMTECQLVQVLGDPTAASPALQPGSGRHMTMVYANPDGTSTAYVFVNNALKEMNLVSNTPQPLPAGSPPPG